MNHVLRVLTLAVGLSAIGCVAARGPELSSAEIAEILQIKAWRILEPANGHEWSLEVVTEAPTVSARLLEQGSALVSLRDIGSDEYEFVLKQRGAHASGTVSLCREPEGSASICESYSVEFEPTPRCLEACSRALLARVESTSDTNNKRGCCSCLSRP